MDYISERNHTTSLTMLFVILVQLLFFVSGSGDSLWTQYCGLCGCYWNNGRKAANCGMLDLKTIPRNFSSEMQIVDFSHNYIAEIRRNELEEASLQNLQKLYLKNCTLMELNRDALTGLNVLIELDLSQNLLRELHPGTFNRPRKLRKLNLNYNEIKHLPEGLFSDLNFLHTLELKHNQIVRIAPKTFTNLPAVTVIELSFNQLTVLRVNSFAELPKLVAISLEHNPWNCTCHLLDFRKYAVENRYYSQPTDCQEPPHLHGKMWNEVPPEHFACRPEIIQPQKGIRGGPYGSHVEATSENATLTCRVRAAPHPKIGWSFNRRIINPNDRRFHIFNAVEPNRTDDVDIYTSELTIIGTRPQDKGVYSCLVENAAGSDAAEMQLFVTIGRLDHTTDDEASSDLFFIICIIAIVLLLLLIVVVLMLCVYCRRAKQFSNDTTMSDNALMTSKLDKTHNHSMLEGSVMTEVQNSLLTSVNPVEKPPRRANDVESLDADDGHEMKKTLLDDTAFGSQDEETNSVALSDTTARSRQAFIEDGHGANLPPDLLSFQPIVPQSPSVQSSISNIQDSRIYAKSPLASPVYQHVVNQPAGHPNNNGLYGVVPIAFRTLQHPKSRNLSLMNSPRNNSGSPFVQAPIVYPPVVMKQGYMTIPRKSRVARPPSCSTTLSEFEPICNNVPEGSSLASSEVEPVYDNLGVRTTAGGNSSLNLTKIGSSVSQQNLALPSRYTMKDRPLPATPNIAITGTPVTTPPRIYEPIEEVVTNLTVTSDTEPLYGTAKNGGQGVTIVPSNMNGMSVVSGTTLDRISKIPPRPPPKPKKKISVTSTHQGSARQLFEDEGEDGTEV